MRIYTAVLITVGLALLATGVLTYPDVPGLVVLAMVITGALMVMPTGSRQRENTPVGVTR
ncbi:hypothetical protein [Halostreptopolyspora alba]|uniref:Uncharacterized protein n=1 Tax=Halostreptopolyspora alba TaxID=2487137 RepID=A0A3N0E6T4_9ACTN|nr:hypothetical protein EFW17_15050 [Nocardiopsaceae bacterium YIM 96095]